MTTDFIQEQIDENIPENISYNIYSKGKGKIVLSIEKDGVCVDRTSHDSLTWVYTHLLNYIKSL